MLRFICLLLLIFGIQPLWAGQGAPIEIYAAGKRYASLDLYKNRHIPLKEVKNTSAQTQEIQETAKALGITVDLNKIKTIEVGHQLSLQTQANLKLAGADRGLDRVIANFRQNWNNPESPKVATGLLLEDKIREAVGDQKDPVLLISDHGKMRILALTPKDLPN